jgi:hypothetical protein
MISEIKAGPQIVSDGVVSVTRSERTGALVAVDGRGHYAEAASRNTMFTLVLSATTTGIAAGNINGAAAAASTQFALWNPIGSGKNLELLRFGLGLISGTPAAGPFYHNIMVGVPSLTTSTGTAYSNLIGPSAPSVARWMASAGGSALTGGVALTTFALADFDIYGFVATVAGQNRCIENLDGSIILTPGTGWVPCWTAGGTTVLNAYSITWQEVNP